ncbi:MAG: dihydrofolate reductase [Planctomycetota bacterium]
MLLSLIYARSRNRVIGADGGIPWRLPDDFAHFKRTTLGKPIVMGRKTYEDHNSALPGRLNLVVTRNIDYAVAKGVEVMPSLEAALARAAQDSDQAFVIGGVGLFEAALPKAQAVYETVVDADIAGDAVLPQFDFTDGWTTRVLQEHRADERHAHAFTVYRHDRV